MIMAGSAFTTASSLRRILRQHILEKGFQFSQVLTRGRMNDDCPIFTLTIDFSHAKSIPFESTSNLGSSKSNVQLLGFDIVHGQRLQTKSPSNIVRQG